MTTHASSLMTGAPLSLNTALLRNSSTVVLKGVIGIASGLSLHLSKGVTLSHSACITHRVLSLTLISRKESLEWPSMIFNFEQELSNGC